MIDHAELRRGLYVEYEGQIWQVVEHTPFRHAQRAAMIRIKLRNLRTGRTLERTLQPGDKLYRVSMELKTVQFLYKEGDLCNFMDTETFDQFPIDSSVLGNSVNYLKEGMELQLMSFKGKPLTVELPITVDLKVVETGPAFKGDTAQSGTKLAKLETGIEVKVPLFISVGEIVRLDTNTGEYLERTS
jgi:elongation factor P